MRTGRPRRTSQRSFRGVVTILYIDQNGARNLELGSNGFLLLLIADRSLHRARPLRAADWPERCG
jgi:hypothetical protein